MSIRIFGTSYDLDDLFAFTAEKSVIIRDRKLGFLQYSIMVAIMVYVVIFQVIGATSYLAEYIPTNIVRLELLDPTRNDCDIDNAGCKEDLVPITHLSYCAAQNSSCQCTKKGRCKCDYSDLPVVRPCQWLDAIESSFPAEKSITVSTMIRSVIEERSCFLNSDDSSTAKVLQDTPECDRIWNVKKVNSLFVANVERYSLLIDHSMQGAGSGAPSINSRDIEGRLWVGNRLTPPNDIQKALCKSRPDAVDKHGKPTNSAPCFLQPILVDKFDTITVETLLGAMGLSLDDTALDSEESYREAGLNIDLQVYYNNRKDWVGLVNNTYTYYVNLVPHSFGQTDSFIRTGNTRVTRQNVGIRFNVRPTGHLAEFSMDSLLTELTTSLTMLAMAAVIVNLLAKYALNHSKYYSQLLIETSPDFSDVHEVEKLSEETLNKELSAKMLNPMWGTERKVIAMLDHGYTPAGSS